MAFPGEVFVDSKGNPGQWLIYMSNFNGLPSTKVFPPLGDEWWKSIETSRLTAGFAAIESDELHSDIRPIYFLMEPEVNRRTFFSISVNNRSCLIPGRWIGPP